MSRQSSWLGVLVMLLAGGLAACHGSGGDKPPSSPKGTLRIGVVRPSSLDPAQARSVDELLVADQLFDSLTAWDPKSLAPVPSLAARWTVTTDQLHWDFTLRKGARFANGRAVTSADVKYSLERIAHKGSTASGFDLLEPVAGYKAFAIDGTAADLAGITTPAPDVVHIDLEQPMSSLASVLGSPAFAVVPKEAVEAASPAFGERPVGSGPFKLVRVVGTSRMVLAPRLGSAALVARLEVWFFADKAASYQAFTQGRLDWSEVPPERVTQAAVRYGRTGYQPYVAELFYGFNLKSPTFADVRFREAIIHAVDRQRIISSIYADTVRPMIGLVPRGVDGQQADPCGERCTYDPDKAKALLAEAFPGAAPPEVAIDFDDDRTQAAVAKAIQADLTAVGIPATLRAKPLDQYQNFAVSGDQQLFRLGWVAAYPSADDFLTPMFVTGFPSNLTGLSSNDVDTLLRSARAEPDGTKRLEKFKAAERAVFDQLPVLPIAQFDFQTVSAERVRDLVVTAAGGFDGSKVWLKGG